MTPASVVAVEPLSQPPDAVVSVPGSKSLTNRALLCAALADGTSRVTGALVADDSAAMIDALGRLGMAIDLDDAGGTVSVRGRAGTLPHGPLTIDCRSAATVARFLTPVLATAAGPFVVDGSTQLRERPMEPVLAALTQLGARVTMSGHLGTFLWRSQGRSVVVE